MADSKLSQNSCHLSGSHVKIGISSFGSRAAKCPTWGALTCIVNPWVWDRSGRQANS